MTARRLRRRRSPGESFVNVVYVIRD